MREKKKPEKKLTRKQREFALRRREILSAALRLFSEKGYHQTSMSEIAKEAEFSIGSLYSFFKDKEDLFLNLFKEEIEEIERQVNEVFAKELGVKEKLHLLLDTLFGYFEKRQAAFHIFALNQKELGLIIHTKLAESIRLRHFQFLKDLSEVIGQGIEQGIFRALRPEQMALALMGMSIGSIFLWVELGSSYSLKERVSEVLDIFYKGVEKI